MSSPEIFFKKFIMARAINGYTVSLSFFYFTLMIPVTVFPQQTTIVNSPTDPGHKVVIAGKQYEKSDFHNRIWGSHYRKEWATPVKVPVFYLDSANGGLTPVEKGGGRQTRNLRLEDRNGKQFVLRSIDKTYKRALPKEFSGTFVETVANDQVSVAHPFAPFTVPIMAQAAGIFHTNPRLIFLPKQNKLGEYNEEFGDQLYLLEERPDGDQRDAPWFGNAEDVIGTDKMMENILADNKYKVDQNSFVRARLFDMFLSDWGRHEDQWRWAEFKKDNLTIYKPIPRDRDQAYTKFDGLIVGMLAPSAATGYLQSFDHAIKDINTYNYLARHLDRRFLNEIPLSTWIATAKELQNALTDAVIEKAIRQLPPEVFPISGPEIIAKLKSRREQLAEFAKEYYASLATEVDIPGSRKDEFFEIKKEGENVVVNIFRLENGNKTGEPLYTRTFRSSETKEIRLYGVDGNDIFRIDPVSSIKTRIIGGPSKDIYEYTTSNEKSTAVIYDDDDNTYNTHGNIKIRKGYDSAFHAYDYNEFKYDKKGIKPGISYNADDRLYVTLGYSSRKQSWRKVPFGYENDVNINYSLIQKAFSAQYKGIFNQVLGNWDVGLLANYDAVRDVYFAGIGNNSVKNTDKLYYRMRTREFNSGLNFIRRFDSINTVTLSGFFRIVKLLKDDGKYIAVNQGNFDPTLFDHHNYVGAKFEYLLDNINSRFVATKGFKFNPAISYTYDATGSNSWYRFSGVAGFYLPVFHSLVLAVKTGAATVTGQPPFYELNKLGGGNSLRGHMRYRFYGKTSFYNQDELQWNIPVKSWLMNGKIGLLGFIDNGRVWQPGEISDTWQTGYGFGLMIAPFNKFSFTASYGMSSEDHRIHIRVGRLL
jgi:hypothetical protein